jgi:hypothetical protein
MSRQNGTATLQDDAYEWVTVEEAARRMSTSPSTIRRMIRDGSLTGELQDRSARDRRQQFVVRVNRLQTAPDGAIPAPDDAPSMAIATDLRAIGSLETRQTAPEPRHEASPASAAPPEAIALAFVGELRAVRQVADARADQLVSQAAEIGQLRAERDGARNDARTASERATAAEAERDAAREALAVLARELAAERARSWWDRLRGR